MLHLSTPCNDAPTLDITQHLDSEMLDMFSDFVKNNQYDQALNQRFSKIKSRVIQEKWCVVW